MRPTKLCSPHSASTGQLTRRRRPRRPRRAPGRCSRPPGSPRRTRRSPPGRRSSARTRPGPPGRTGPPACRALHPGPDPELRVGADQPLRDAVRCGQEEPVVVAEPERLVGVREDVPGGHDVQHRQRGHRAGVIQGEPVPDPAAAVVADHREPVEARAPASRPAGRRPSPVWRSDVVGRRGRLAAVAVATQVGEDHGVLRPARGATRCQITCVCG